MRSFIAVTFLLFFEIASAQTVKTIFHPSNPYFYSNDQVWNFSLINTGRASITATIEIAISSGGSYQIFHTLTSPVTLSTGENAGQFYTSKAISVSYSSDASGTYFKNTSLLAAGSYSLCIWVRNLNNETLSYSCQELKVNAITPPILTYPYNHQVLSTVLPQLTWIPVMPQGIPGLKYLLELWELGPNNSLAKRIMVSQKTSENSFQYSAMLPPLSQDKVYQWQVSAFTGSYYLGKSQLWDFTLVNNNSSAGPEGLRDEDSVDETVDVDTDSYRIVGDETIGADYVATGYLRIAYNNVANDTVLPYKISLTDKPDVFLNNLPLQPLAGGLNQISLNLGGTSQFEDNQTYTLEIEDGNGHLYYLDFLYLTP